MSDLKESLRAYRERGKNGLQLLKEPETSIEDLAVRIPRLSAFPVPVQREVALDIKYEGYLARQEAEAESLVKKEAMKIPQDFDYDSLKGLSSESREKLKQVRPVTIAQAQRISGLRVSDIALLMMGVRHWRGKGDQHK